MTVRVVKKKTKNGKGKKKIGTIKFFFAFSIFCTAKGTPKHLGRLTFPKKTFFWRAILMTVAYGRHYIIS